MLKTQASRRAGFAVIVAAGAVAVWLMIELEDLGSGLIVGIGFGILIGQFVHCGRIARIVKDTHGPSRVMFERGKEMGYQLGWRDGHRTARPVVVPFVHDENPSRVQFFSS